MNTKPIPVKDVAARVGGMTALAEKLGIHRSAPHQWADGVPLGRVRDVSRLTGLAYHELRPDHFDPPEGA